MYSESKGFNALADQSMTLQHHDGLMVFMYITHTEHKHTDIKDHHNHYYSRIIQELHSTTTILPLDVVIHLNSESLLNRRPSLRAVTVTVITQFPIHLCFDMTINKSQSQSFFFTRGQFNVAMSRVTDVDNLSVLLLQQGDGKVGNIVYPEVLLCPNRTF